MSLGNDRRKLFKRLRAAGYDVEQSSSHFKVGRDGVFLCSMSVSPSDAHWIKVVERDLRKRGVMV